MCELWWLHSQHHLLLLIFHFSRSPGVEENLIMALICMLLMNSNTEHFLMVLLAINIVSSVKCMFKCLAPLFNWVVRLITEKKVLFL